MQQNSLPTEFVYELTIRCNLTKLEKVIAGPWKIRDNAEEEMAMYARHSYLNTLLFITTKEKHLCDRYEIFKDERANPFNAKNDRIGNEKLAEKKEKNYVSCALIACGAKMYTENNTIRPCVDLINSLWHKGYINVLFDMQHCSYKDIVWGWIDHIGTKYDPEILNRLTGWNTGSGIYVNGFFTNDVVRLCEYCQQVFGVNKYETANLFHKRDVSVFNIDPPDSFGKEYNLTRVAAVYAENGEIEKAMEYYIKSNRKHKLQEFESYVEKHGTSVLSSYF